MKSTWKTLLLLFGCIIFTLPYQVKKTIQRYQKLFSVYFKILYKYKDNIFFSQTQTSTTQTGQRKEDYSDTANKFQGLIKDLNLDLAIVFFTPTRARSLSEKLYSTIDLSFISSSFSNSLIFSKIALQFFHESDHRSILTSLDLDPPRKTWKLERNWKTLDSNLTRVECEKLQLSSHFQDKDKVDKYLEYLDNFLQEVVSKYTQLQK